MKVKLLSDLHLEFGVDLENMPYFKYDDEDVLVLAGDINTTSAKCIQTLQKFHDEGYPHIVYVAGNHEYYAQTFSVFNADLRRFSEANVGWCHFLNKDWTVIGDALFIGSTLWTNFHNNPIAEHAAHRGIRDFTAIPGFTTQECKFQNETDVAYIKNAIKVLPPMFPDCKVYVVTHFLPANECIAAQYRKDGGLLNDYFANNLDEYLSSVDKEIAWLYGHTHTPGVQKIGNVTLIANPYGYHGYEDTSLFKNKCYV